MSNEEKIMGILGIFLLLYLLFRRTTKVQGVSTSALVDSITGFKIGYNGVSSDTHIIGEAVIPPGIPNDTGNSAFVYAAQNNEISCPQGYEPIIDGLNHKVYCILQGYGSDVSAQELYQQSQDRLSKILDQGVLA